MTNGNSVRLDFCSTFDMLDFVQVVCDHVGRMAGLDEDSVHWVGVAVRESVINAIKHGNANDEQKRVYVEFTPLDADIPGIAIRVRDEFGKMRLDEGKYTSGEIDVSPWREDIEADFNVWKRANDK